MTSNHGQANVSLPHPHRPFSSASYLYEYASLGLVSSRSETIPLRGPIPGYRVACSSLAGDRHQELYPSNQGDVSTNRGQGIRRRLLPPPAESLMLSLHSQETSTKTPPDGRSFQGRGSHRGYGPRLLQTWPIISSVSRLFQQHSTAPWIQPETCRYSHVVQSPFSRHGASNLSCGAQGPHGSSD